MSEEGQPRAEVWQLRDGAQCVVVWLSDSGERIPVCDESTGVTIEIADVQGKPGRISVDPGERALIDRTQLANLMGRVQPSGLEKLMRSMILDQVTEYYRAFHRPKQDAAFVSGDRITYAGRVFDAAEMRNGAEAVLDFWLTSGRFCDEFERRFASRLGARFSCLVNSGSSANLVAFFALTSPLLGDRRLRPGDEVITVAGGFPTTISPAIQAGCHPVFVDLTIEDGTYNIDTAALEAAVSPRTRAVMIAHTLGNPFRIDEVVAFCKKHALFLIEDNCDALGSRYRGQMTGTFGDLATSSFYPPHHLTMGEDGAVYGTSVKWKRIVESIRDWGRDCWCPSGKDNTCGKRFAHEVGTLPKGYDHKYTYRHFGFNLKATEMQAAIGVAQLDKLELFVQKRRAHWQMLREGLADCEDLFILPNPTPQSEPSWFGFLLTLRETEEGLREKVTAYLESKGIQTRLLFAGNITRQPCFDDLRARGAGFRVIGDLRETDRVMSNGFWLGVYPGLKAGMIEHMVAELKRFFGR